MQTQIAKHWEVDYDDDLHRYSLGGVRYLSATQVLEEFIEEFDVEAQSIRMANDWGQTPEYWKKKWAEAGYVARERGNKIHNRNEDQLHARAFDVIHGNTLRVHNRALYETEIPYIELPDGVWPELKLWRHDYQIAGRADKPIFRTLDSLPEGYWTHLIQDGHNAETVANLMLLKQYRIMDIEDYKTNRYIQKESFYTRNKETGEKQYRMMKAPLGHLMDCNYNHYALQLSLYQFMGEYHGFLPGYRRIIHYPHEIPGLGTPDPYPIELPYLRREVIALLEHLNRKVA